MKKHLFLLLFFVFTQNLFAQFEPSLSMQSPDYRHLVKTWDYVQPGGFTPYRAKIKVEVFDNSTAKRLNKIIIKDARNVKRITFNDDSKELVLIVSDGFINEAIKIDFERFCEGKKRFLVISRER